MRLVLDTDALWNPRLVQGLTRAQHVGLMQAGRLDAVLPAVAFAERRRQVQRDRRALAAWLDTLGEAGIRVEPFDAETARNLRRASQDDQLWRRHARDFLIAAHVHGNRIGVTSDRGPAWEGLPVLHPPEAARTVERLLAAGGG